MVIQLHYDEEFKKRRMRMDVLSKMNQLKLLMLKNVNFYGNLNYISNELRYLY